MPMLFGLLFGRLFARIAFSRAVVTLALWVGVVFVGVRVGVANFSDTGGYVLGALAPAALLGWALWQPATSRARLWLIDGVYLWLRLGMWWFAGAAALRFAADGLMLSSLPLALPYFAAAAGLWAAQRALAGWVARSHRLAGDRSVMSE